MWLFLLLELLIALSVSSRVSAALDVGFLECVDVKMTPSDVTSEHCFTAHNVTMTQSDAEAACASEGAYLAWITTMRLKT